MNCDEKGPRTATECTPCGANIRNRYFRGKLMTVADYQAEQRYMIHRRRTVNRLLLGWGVIRGFRIRLDGDRLVIGKGAALDPCGREIIACDRVIVDDCQDVVWLDEGKCGAEPTDPFDAGCYLLSAHYAERLVDGVRVSTGCDESECETNHVCETVVYSLRPVDPAHPPILRLECSNLEPRRGQRPAGWPNQLPHVGPVDNRGQANLCLHDPVQWGEQRRFDPCCAPRLCNHGGLQVDLDAPVPLAIVCFSYDDCKKPVFNEVREIIRGCELTRIQDIGWRNWHETPNPAVHTYTFFDMFVTPTDVDDRRERPDGKRRKGEPVQKRVFAPVDTRFWICFTAPVQIASLNRDAVSITRYELDSNEAVGIAQRIEVAGIWHEDTRPGDPKGTTRGIRPFVSHEFWDGEIDSDASSSFLRDTLVELRVHGDRIIDWAGRPVDGNSIAHRLPSGNHTPGGDFLSSWRVVPDGEELPARADQGATQAAEPNEPAQAVEPNDPTQATEPNQPAQADPADPSTGGAS